MTTISVHDVVAFFLSKSDRPLSASTLHKMAYYAQGWHLAWVDAPLFEEEIRTRKAGPFIPALFPYQKDGVMESSWPVGNAAAVTGDTARVLETVFNSYAHLSGLSLGELANGQAPCRLALSRATDEDTRPVINVSELKAFFKAFNDAPKDATAYANRFMDRYADTPASP